MRVCGFFLILVASCAAVTFHPVDEKGRGGVYTEDSVEASEPFVTAASKPVYTLDHTNFDRMVSGTKRACVLVKFYAPWCGHCKRLAPVYEELGEKYRSNRAIVIAEIDGSTTENRPFMSRFGIRGYPTMKLFKPASGSKDTLEFRGSRTVEALSAFLEANCLGDNALKLPPVEMEKKPATEEKPKEKESSVLSLTDQTFPRVVWEGGHTCVMVMFFAPWCGHCKRMEPTYAEVAAAFKAQPEIVIARVDGNEAAHRSLLKEQGVRGFPTVKLFRPALGVDGTLEYRGPRTKEDISAYLETHCTGKEEKEKEEEEKEKETEKEKEKEEEEREEEEEEEEEVEKEVEKEEEEEEEEVEKEEEEDEKEVEVEKEEEEDEKEVEKEVEKIENKKELKKEKKMEKKEKKMEKKRQKKDKKKKKKKGNTGMPLVLTEANFDETVANSPYLLVKFFAPWCGHCKRLAPVYEEIAAHYEGSSTVTIAEVDTGQERGLGGRFAIRGVPTLLLFKKGTDEPIKYSGGRTKEAILSFLETTISEDQ